MSIVAYCYDFVIGVDTHARNHALAMVACPTGEQVTTAQFPASGAGMARAIAWVARHTRDRVLWSIEGAGSYGAQLAAMVSAGGHQVVEAPRMNPRTRRGIGKSDELDALAIARATLPVALDQLRHLRADTGPRAALRVLIGARDQMSTERTRTVNALTALVRTIALGVGARRALSAAQITQITRWHARNEPAHLAVARTEAVRLAKRVGALDRELATNLHQITQVIAATPAAPLLAHTGIGPVTAAVVLLAWSHPGRVRNDAAFAALAGVNPIPASSGNTTRHRLNRGGDRRLNQALHMATISRMTHDPAIRAYVERRRTEGKTTKEIRRCLKRYLARNLYRELNTLHT